MAGGKRRAKVKEVAASLFSPSPPVPNQPEEDDGLIDDLLAHFDERSATSKQEVTHVLHDMEENDHAESAKKKGDSRSRFQARQARKAAELAASYAPVDEAADARIAREAKEEEASILTTCQKLGVEMCQIPPDGHCMFNAIADQLYLLGVIPAAQVNPATTRVAAATYIATHPDDFLPFLPSIEGEDGAGATDSSGLMSQQQLQTYCRSIAETSAWGGQPELLALARAYNVEIDVVQGGEPPIVKTKPVDGTQRFPTALISYHRRMYGLGEHYNSLRPKKTASL